MTIRDGFGQTETTWQIGNSPGQPVKPGSMGRPMPGYAVALVDLATRRARRERGRDLPRPVRAPARPDGRLPRRRRADRRGHGAAATTTPATSASATPTATSPTSGAPTTCSRPATTGSSPFELESVLHRAPGGGRGGGRAVAGPAAAGGAQGVRRAGRRASSRPRRRRGRSSRTPGSTWRRTSGSGGWSSPSCPRRSPARSAGSSCAAASGTFTRTHPRRRPASSLCSGDRWWCT